MDRIIRVSFRSSHNAAHWDSSRTYAYFTDDETIQEGDFVVVDAPSSGLTVVKVVSLEETVEAVERVGKWIVQKVDCTAYDARIAKQERKAVILAKLKRARQEMIEQMDYAALTAANPDLKALVDELSGL